MKPAVLITGGAGYIGSHTVYAFKEAGWPVIVIDNLSTGVQALLPPDVPFYKADIADNDRVNAIINKHNCRVIVHFAGSIIVSESVLVPEKYYYNNTSKSLDLINTFKNKNLDAFVFSSTAAVYGVPHTTPISEDAPLLPINPYGSSKLVTENMLKDICKANNLNYGILRYFNVAGADEKKRTGQYSVNSTHLIKIIAEVLTGKRDHLEIYGTDYPTLDGTCVRDYIHVSDLAKAHVLTVEHLLSQKGTLTLNCGYGHGFSVKQVINAAQDVAKELKKKPIPVKISEQRAGDPAALVANNQNITDILGWKPQYDDLHSIIKSAVVWEDL